MQILFIIIVGALTVSSVHANVLSNPQDGTKIVIKAPFGGMNINEGELASSNGLPATFKSCLDSVSELERFSREYPGFVLVVSYCEFQNGKSSGWQMASGWISRVLFSWQGLGATELIRLQKR